jgi:hypothetical protein
MLTEDYKKIVEEVMKTGHEIMKKNGSVGAMYFLVLEDEIIPVPPVDVVDVPEDVAKKTMAFLLAMAAKKAGANMTMMIDEIWMSTPPLPKNIKTIEQAKEYAHSDATVRPSEDPNRKEGLVVIATLPGGESHVLMSALHRDKKGKPHLEKPEWVNAKIETRMMNKWATDA